MLPEATGHPEELQTLPEATTGRNVTAAKRV